MTENEEKWGVLEDKWRFYWPLSWFSQSNFLVEFLVFIHVYLLAAYLAIREAIFDRNGKIEKIKTELFSTHRWSAAQKFQKSGKNRKILVVGGDGTIGSEIVQLIRSNSEFELHVVTHHKFATGRKLEFLRNDDKITIYEADLIDKEQILLLANQLKSMQFDVAIFAAGIMLFPECRTKDGVEMHNALNVIGQLMLFELLHHDIKRSIFLSSATARMALFSKNPDFLSEYAGPYQAYASSKLNLAVYVAELARRRHISAVTVHPGTVPGRLYRYANTLVQLLNAKLLPKVMRSPEMAAALVLHTVFREDLEDGRYYEDGDTVDVVEWVPEKIRHMIYDTIHRRIEMWMEH